MLISYLLSQTHAHRHTQTRRLFILKKIVQGESKQHFCVSDSEEEKSQGAPACTDEKHSKDREERISLSCLTKSPDAGKEEKKGDV